MFPPPLRQFPQTCQSDMYYYFRIDRGTHSFFPPPNPPTRQNGLEYSIRKYRGTHFRPSPPNSPPPHEPVQWNIPSVIMRESLLSINPNPNPSQTYPLPLEYSFLTYRGERLCLSQPNSNRSRSIAYPRILRELRVKPFSLTHLIAAPTLRKENLPCQTLPPRANAPPDHVGSARRTK